MTDTRPCAVCGAVMEITRHQRRKMYCSERCRQKGVYRSRKPRLTEQSVTTMWPPHEKAEIQRAAKLAGISMSEFVRRAVRAAIRRE